MVLIADDRKICQAVQGEFFGNFTRSEVDDVAEYDDSLCIIVWQGDWRLCWCWMIVAQSFFELRVEHFREHRGG